MNENKMFGYHIFDQTCPVYLFKISLSEIVKQLQSRNKDNNYQMSFSVSLVLYLVQKLRYEHVK